jgi:hypothetical protein|tara:strand:- start:20044 stop:20430 length:387 start_codon:yes stop_codon:yes gene_type:complete
MGKWIFTFFLIGICSLYYIVSNVTIQKTNEGIFISLGLMFWIGVLVYLCSSIILIFLKVSKRFKRFPAGIENMERLRAFSEKYPSIAQELSLNKTLSNGASYGQLIKIKKIANRKLVKMASTTFTGGT